MIRGNGDIPMSKEVWEEQYSKGQWDHLDQLRELAHYSVLVGYIHYLKPGGSILDIGCGKGILQERLALYGYSKYVGIDISDNAIRQASCKEDDETTFVAGDATRFSPVEAFDTIVFNEVLYYFDDPLKTVERYERYLQRNGIFIVSLYVTELAAAIIERRLESVYLSLDKVKITNESNTWVCNVFTPREQGQPVR